MAGRIVKLFLDSNVILSGLLSDKGAPRIILDILSLNLPFLSGLTGEFNVLEIERNLKRKLPGLFSVYRKYFSRINLQIVPLPRPAELKDFFGMATEKDVPVLVSAIRGGADFLITGDKKHFGKIKLPAPHALKIVTPSEFVDLFLPEIIKTAPSLEKES
jgi:predicted nucleic acid-binding protein